MDVTVPSAVALTMWKLCGLRTERKLATACLARKSAMTLSSGTSDNPSE